MSYTQEGTYVTDSVTGDVYYAVQYRKYGGYAPASLILYSDIKCDPTTAINGITITNKLVPTDPATGGGGAAPVTVSGPVTVDTVTNPVTVGSITNPVTVGSITNPVTVDTITNPVSIASNVRTPFYSRTTVAGTVAAGARKIAIGNVGATDATVLGVVLAAGEVITFEAEGQDTIGAVAYDPQTSTLSVSGLT